MCVQTVRNKSIECLCKQQEIKAFLGENTEVCANSKETAVGKNMK